MAGAVRRGAELLHEDDDGAGSVARQRLPSRNRRWRDGNGFAAWGRLTSGGFDGEVANGKGNVRMDGRVTTGIVGADVARSRWLAGVGAVGERGDPAGSIKPRWIAGRSGAGSRR